jgi:hypothetical protein
MPGFGYSNHVPGGLLYPTMLWGSYALPQLAYPQLIPAPQRPPITPVYEDRDN